MNQINTIFKNPHPHSNSSLVSERQLAIIPKNSILGNRKLSSEEIIDLLDKTNKSNLNKNNRTNQNKTSILSLTANQIINKIDKRRKINLPKIPKIPISVPINPKNLPPKILHIQPNNSSSPSPSVTKDQNSEFSGDQFSDNQIFFNYETKPRKRKNINILNPSTESYTTHRDKNIITKNHQTPSILKSDDSSSASNIATQRKKLLRCRKKVNNDLIDTDLINSTYDNISPIKNSTHQSNSDSIFKLSSNTSSSSINEQQPYQKRQPFH